MRSLICLMVLLSVMTKLNAQVEHLEGQTKLKNPEGRTLMLERDNEDSWLTFHDPGDFWYSLGIDRSNSGKFCINVGGSLNSSQFVMDGDGKVGIGTSVNEPGWKFEVAGLCALGATYGESRLYVSAGSGYTNLQSRNNTVPQQMRYLASSHYFDANVGIGTTATSTHKLAVDGTIGAREIKVESSGWSDFVFEDSYKLKDLEEVESFIEENKHLPDVPSEKEVLENGIQLGKMDAKLLQKIEELTLYMIEQNKKTNKVIEENKALKKRVEYLERIK